MSRANIEIFVFAIIASTLIMFVAGLFFFRRYTGLSKGKAMLALSGSLIAAVIVELVRMQAWRRLPNTHDESTILTPIAAGAAFYFATAFALRLWGRWIGGLAAPEEQRPGIEGVRAWF